MISLAQRMSKIKPSATLALSAKATQMKESGLDVISLTVGEPDWNTVDSALEAGVQALKAGFTKYAPSNGYLDLRTSIAEHFQTEFGVKYNADEVTVSTGGKFVLYALMQTLLNEGDEVIIPAPYWVSYPTLVEMAEGKSVFIAGSESRSFKLAGAELHSAMNSKTKAFILNSPSNPTGETYSEAELKEIADVLLSHPQVVIITDDIYNHLYFDAPVAPHILKVAPELKSRTIVVSGASKSYSMTGWRVGWALGPKEVISAMNKIQSQTVSCAASFSQKAVLAAIGKDDEELRVIRTNLKERMETAYTQFKKIDKLKLSRPTGAFYIWLDVRAFLGQTYNGEKIESSSDFSRLLLEHHHVAVVPGIEFGLDGFLRVSYAISESRLSEAVERFHQFVQKLQA